MSPVIILGLVLMWAVVLVPMWLRRHDEVEESRSVDRFSTAMHTLSRHEARPAQRNVRPSYRGTRPGDVHVHVSGASAPEAAAARRRQSLARRRGRLMASLLVAGAVVLVAAVVMGGVLLWVLGVSLLLGTVTYVIHLRRAAVFAEASRRRAAARRRDNAVLDAVEREPISDSQPQWQEGITVRRGPVSMAAEPTPTATDELFDQAEPWDETDSPYGVAAAVTSSAPVASSDGVFDQESDFEVAASYRPTFMETGVIRASSPQAEPELEEEPEYETRAARAAAHAAAEAAAVGGKPWEPIPVPRPTYAMKPVAPSRPTRPAPRERLLPPVEEVVAHEADDDLEAILDRRWAVND